MAWWRRDRDDPPALTAAAADLAAAEARREEYDPVSRELDRLVDAVRRSMRPPPRGRGPRVNGGRR